MRSPHVGSIAGMDGGAASMVPAIIPKTGEPSMSARSGKRPDLASKCAGAKGCSLRASSILTVGFLSVEAFHWRGW